MNTLNLLNDYYDFTLTHIPSINNDIILLLDKNNYSINVKKSKKKKESLKELGHGSGINVKYYETKNNMNSIVKPTKYGNLTYFSLNSYLSPITLLKQNKKYSFSLTLIEPKKNGN